MAANKKLTGVIKGRTIKSAPASTNALDITFGDGSKMHVKTGAQVATDGLSNKTVVGVRQTGTTLKLDFDDHSSAQVTLAEATSSVLLRDKDGKMEYAD